MTPAFSSLHDFLAMGGYGFYVWLSVLVALISLSALLITAHLQRWALLAEVRHQQAREQRIRKAREKEQAHAASS